jgi:hypothetical protein
LLLAIRSGGLQSGLFAIVGIGPMSSTDSVSIAEVRVRRHQVVPECEVLVAFRGQEMRLKCPNYSHAVKWARIECKAYRVEGGFTVEVADD